MLNPVYSLYELDRKYDILVLIKKMMPCVKTGECFVYDAECFGERTESNRPIKVRILSRRAEALYHKVVDNWDFNEKFKDF